MNRTRLKQIVIRVSEEELEAIKNENGYVDYKQELPNTMTVLDYVTKEEKTEEKLVSGLHCEVDVID